MSYAALVADLTLNTTKLEQGLQHADNAMRNLTRANWVVYPRLDTRAFGQQVGQLKRVMASMGQLTVPVTMDVRVNGQAVAIQKLGAIEKQVAGAAKAAETAGAKIAVVHRNLEGMGGATALKFNGADMMKGLERVSARVLKFKQDFAFGTSNGDITGTINKLEHFFSGQGIKADAFNKVIPELQRVLELQKDIKGNRVLDFEIHVNKNGLAEIGQINLAIDGAKAKLDELARAKNAANVDKRGLADDLRSRGVFASVIGGEKNINADLFKSANAKGVPMAHMEMGTPMGMDAAQMRAAVAELERFDKAAAVAAKESREIGKAMDANAGKTLKALGEMDRGLNGVVSQIKRVEREEDRAHNAMTRWGATGKGLHKQLQGIGNTVMRWAIGYTVVSNLIKLTDAATYAVIGYNDMLDRSRISFTTFLDGSTTRADAFLGKLREFARVTPFEFKDLVPLTQRLVALGVVTEKEIEGKAIPAIRAIGNVAATTMGGQAAIEGITRALGQMATKSKLSSEEVNQQLAEWGVNGWRYLSKAMGKSVDEVQALTKKGMIDGRQAALAILEGMDNDPRFKGAMAKLSRTFTGATSNISDGLRDIIGTATSTQFGIVTKKLVEIADLLNSPEFQQRAVAGIGLLVAGFERLGSMIVWVAQIVSDKLPYLIALLTLAGGAKIVGGIKLLGGSLALAFGTAAMPILIATGAILAFVAAYRNFPIIQDITEGVVGSVLVGLKGLSHGFYWVTGQIGAFVGKIGDLMGWLKKIPTSVTTAMNIALPGSGSLLSGLGGLSDGLKQLAADTAGMETESDKYWDELINGFINTGSKKFKQAMTSDWKGLFNLDGMMSGLMDDAKKAMAEAEKEAKLGPTGPLIKTVANTQAQAQQLDKIAQAYDKAGKAAEDSGKRQLDALKGVRDILRDVFGTIQDSLASYGILNSPLDGVISRIEKLANIGPRAVQIAQNTLKASNDYFARAKTAKDSAQSLRSVAGNTTGGNPSGAAAGTVPLVQAGQAAGDTMIQSMVRRFNDSADRKLGASCADVASNVLNTLGEKLKYSANAAQLKKNALAAGWMMVPLGTPGALHVQTGAGFGRVSGAHTTVGIGGGRVAGSSGYKYQEYDITKGRGNPIALMPAGGVRPNTTRIPGFLKNAIGTGNEAALLAGGDAEAFKQEVMGLLKDLKVSKLSPLPAQWGAPLKDAEGSANRFRVQMMLANGATQKLLMAGLGVMGFGKLAWELRHAANEADGMLNSLKLAADAEAELRDGRKAATARRNENNPFAELEAKYLKNGRFQIPVFVYMNLVALTRGEIKDALDKTEKESVANIKRQRALSSASLPFLQRGDEYGAARATDLLGKAQTFGQTKEMLGLFNTDKGEFNLRMAKQKRLDARAYDEPKAKERGDSVRSMRQEYDRTTSALRETLATVMDATLGETALNDTLAKQETVRRRMRELQLKDGHSETAARKLANEEAAREQIERVMGRQIEHQKTLNALTRQTEDALAIGGAQRGIYGSMSGNDPRFEMALARIEKQRELFRKYKDNPTLTGMGKELSDFDATQEDKYKTNRAAESNARLAAVQNDLLQARATLYGGLSEVQKQMMEWDVKGEAASEAETANRAKTLGILKQIDALKPENWLIEQSRSMALTNPLLTQKARADMQFRQDRTKDGWSDAQIGDALPTDRIFRRMKEQTETLNGILGDWKSTWSETWNDLATTGTFSLSSMLDDMTKRLWAFGAETLSNKVFDSILGLFTNAAVGAVAPSGTGVNLRPSGGSSGVNLRPTGGPSGVNLRPSASFAVGIDRVPRDMTARLHANEMVLNSAQAERHRSQEVAMELARGSARQAAAQNNSGGGNSGDVYNLTINAPGATNGKKLGQDAHQEFNRLRLSRRSNSKNAQAAVGSGFSG